MYTQGWKEYHRDLEYVLAGMILRRLINRLAKLDCFGVGVWTSAAPPIAPNLALTNAVAAGTGSFRSLANQTLSKAD